MASAQHVTIKKKKKLQLPKLNTAIKKPLKILHTHAYKIIRWRFFCDQTSNKNPIVCCVCGHSAHRKLKLRENISVWLKIQLEMLTTNERANILENSLNYYWFVHTAFFSLWMKIAQSFRAWKGFFFDHEALFILYFCTLWCEICNNNFKTCSCFTFVRSEAVYEFASYVNTI